MCDMSRDMSGYYDAILNYTVGFNFFDKNYQFFGKIYEC